MIPARAEQMKKLSRLALELDNATVLAAIQDYYNKPDLSYSDWQHDLIVTLMREGEFALDRPRTEGSA